jgi:RimJ/RimL family protein N-acetyltransferase
VVRVISADDHTPVGITTLQIDSAVRTAEFFILIAPVARGKGLATEATALTLRWAFQYAALRVVWLKVLELAERGGRRGLPEGGISARRPPATIRLLAWSPLR